MGTTIKVIGYGVVMCLIGASASVNFLYGTTLSAGYLGIAFGIIFFLLDILKSLLPVRASAFFRHEERTKGIAAWTISIALSALALTSGHALYLTTVGQGTADITAEQERYSLAKSTKERLEGELKTIGSQRSPGVIEAEIASRKLDKKYSRSDSCRNATLADSRDHCQGIKKLEGELASAKASERLRSDLRAASDKLSGIDISKAHTTANVQGELSDWLAILIPVLLELGCVFGLWLMEQAPSSLRASAQSASQGQSAFGLTPEPVLSVAEVSEALEPVLECPVSLWAETYLKRKAGADTLAADIFPIYQAHCERTGVTALSKNMLGRRLKALGFTTTKRGGKVRYANVQLLKPRLKLVVNQ